MDSLGSHSYFCRGAGTSAFLVTPVLQSRVRTEVGVGGQTR